MPPPHHEVLEERRVLLEVTQAIWSRARDCQISIQHLSMCLGGPFLSHLCCFLPAHFSTPVPVESRCARGWELPPSSCCSLAARQLRRSTPRRSSSPAPMDSGAKENQSTHVFAGENERVRDLDRHLPATPHVVFRSTRSQNKTACHHASIHQAPGRTFSPSCSPFG